MKILTTFFVLPYLIFFSNLASAELIAFHERALNKKQAYVVELSNLQRAAVDKVQSDCEKSGMRKVLVSVSNTFTFPVAEPFASGCWYYANGNVIIDSEVLESDRKLKMTIPTKEFKTTTDFSDWASYSRYSPVVKKPLTKKEQEALETIATGGDKVRMDEVFFGGANVWLTDLKSSSCKEPAEKLARVSGCLKKVARCVSGTGCWNHEDGTIRLSGALLANGTPYPFSGSWSTNEFSQTENFKSWDSTRAMVPSSEK